MAGWIKLHRELANKAIWQESTPEQKTILITLLMMANHQEKEWEWKGERYKAHPGQFVTSLESITKKCGKGISIQNVRTAINRFEKYEFLTNESTNKNRLITIVNWELYQSKDDELTSNLTSNQQATNKQLTTNKNVKNDKNNISIYSVFDSYSENSDIRQALRDYSIMRNKIKAPLTERAVTLLLNKLDALASTDDLKIKLLENATLGNWKSVFPLKEDRPQQAPKVVKPNKFHNFIQSDDYTGEDLEAIARKKFESKIKNIQEGGK